MFDFSMINDHTYNKIEIQGFQSSGKYTAPISMSQPKDTKWPQLGQKDTRKIIVSTARCLEQVLAQRLIRRPCVI